MFCRRDGWQLFSSMQLWEQLVSQTKKSSKDHAALAEIYTTHITQRCSNVNEDLQRMYKKVRAGLGHLGKGCIVRGPCVAWLTGWSI